MSKKAKLILCLMIAFLATTVALTPNTSFAKPKEEEQIKKEEVVYVTQQGKKYHKEGCRFIKNKDTVSMSEQEAINNGLKPCGKCYKEEAGTKQ